MSEIIGIIGGTGILGTTFKELFESQGYEVLISSRRTELTLIELAKKSDAIIFCVPIDVTAKVIQSVLPYTREDQLLMDFTSVKTFPIEEMLKSKASVIGLHPMFGKVKSLEGKTVLVVPARPGKWLSWILDILKKGKVNVKQTTAEKHDEIMAVLQGLLHFNFMIAGKALRDASKKFGLDINDLLEYGGPVYRMRYCMIARLLSQNPELYADIAIKNDKVKEVIDLYQQDTEKLNEIITKKDVEGFVKYYKESGDFFGDFKEEASDDFTELMELFSKLKKK